MSRTNRRRTVRAVAPVAGLLAAGLLVWQGSYAAFSATTVDTGNAWATGQLNLTNNGRRKRSRKVVFLSPSPSNC